MASSPQALLKVGPLDRIRNDEALVTAASQCERWCSNLEAQGLDASLYLEEALRQIKAKKDGIALLIWFTKEDNWRRLEPAVMLRQRIRTSGQTMDFPAGSASCRTCRYGEGFYAVTDDEFTDAELEIYNNAALACTPLRSVKSATGIVRTVFPCGCVNSVGHFDRVAATVVETPRYGHDWKSEAIAHTYGISDGQ